MRSYSTWLEEFVCKKGTADEYYSRSLLPGHLGKYVFKHTPKKTVPQPYCWSYPHYLSIDLSICIVSNQIRPYFKFLKRIPCGFNPSGKYARQWVILFHIWFNITAFFEWSAILCYSNTQFHILPDIHSDSSSGIFSDISYVFFFRAFDLALYLSCIWHSIWHSAFYLTCILIYVQICYCAFWHFLCSQ